jgi:hydrogenase maturation protein HypF
MSAERTARDFRIRGLVQGVGFRPTVYRIAVALGLAGSVYNDAEGVVVHLEGDPRAVDAFPETLLKEKPPLARIDSIEPHEAADAGETAFRIDATPQGGHVRTAITADASVCEACLKEVFDPQDRRWRYAFANCTHCGPRFTITRHLPYDRPQTSMAAFPMCADCRAEYENPLDRRFHAQPIACPVCGPSLTLTDAEGNPLPGDPVRETVKAVLAGKIVAMKGLGGFHLVCDARNAEAVAALRERKHRDEKPLAVMVAGLRSARLFADVTEKEAEVLKSPAHPIVLLKRLPPSEAVPPLKGIADGLGEIGVMLPYTPLHALLFHTFAGEPSGIAWMEEPLELVLVMTSANAGGEPLCTQNDEALRRLAGMADLFLLHNRDIVTRCDDSVVRVADGAVRYVRRSRGYAPEAVLLPQDDAPEKPAVLAAGAYLKNTGALLRGHEAFLTQHIGSLDNAPTERMLEESLAHLEDIFEIAPDVIACDAHPDFSSTHYAEALAAEKSLPLYPIYHHAAHVGVVAAELAAKGPLFGLALDGVGLGPDRSAWGGEALVVADRGFWRAGHLEAMALPGGDRAAREPWRMAFSLLSLIHDEKAALALFADEPQKENLLKMIASPRLSSKTTSMGRLFDGLSALLGFCRRQHDEATAAMLFEAAAARGRAKGAGGAMEDGWRVSAEGVLSFRPLIAFLARERLSGTDPLALAAAAEDTLAAGIADWAEKRFAAAKAAGLVAPNENRLALTGGCFLNRTLMRECTERPAEMGLKGVLPAKVPAGDGGLSLGQAWLARSAYLAGAASHAFMGELGR